MIFHFHSFMGITAGFLSFIAFIPYILSTLKGKNRPNRATWIIWTIVGVILLFSYKAAGATDALWVSIANVLAFGMVLSLSFKYGEGGWNSFDLLCLTGAAIGLFLWWYFSSPLPALYMSILVDLIGAIPTFKKSYLDPAGENLLSWILFWIANTLNLFAVQEWNMAMATYPIYLFLLTGALALILVFRRQSESPPTSSCP